VAAGACARAATPAPNIMTMAVARCQAQRGVEQDDMAWLYRDEARHARATTRPMQRPAAPDEESRGSCLKNA